MKRAVVQVPATTANLGPGFDCLGVALRIYNRVAVERGNARVTEPMIRSAGHAFFTHTSLKAFPFHSRISGDIPISRGLGSSVTVRLGTLAGLNELCGKPLSRQQLFELCAELEGHLDNAAPATFGGFTAASRTRAFVRFPVNSDLFFVLLIPDLTVSTTKARKVLPDEVAYADAVANCSNCARLTAAFASGQYQMLRGSFDDHLHQPYRQRLIPFLFNVIAAGEEAGALGGYLSGSGSTIACLTLASAENVGAAMLEAAAGIPARIVITKADNRGFKIV
jgi:homoserine kinase